MQKNHIEEDEIDLKDIFRTISRYKFTIILTVIIGTLLSAVFAYYKSNIYQASSTIQVSTTNSKVNSNDILQDAIMGGVVSSDIDTEMAILKSRSLIQEAMNSIDLVTHIWEVNKFKKKTELFLDSPIVIDMKKGQGYLFKATPINDKSYNLEVKGVTKNGIKFEYKGTKLFGKEVKHRNFEFTITKTGSPKIGVEYQFIVYEPNYYADELSKKSISVSQLGKKANILKLSYKDSVPLRAKQFVDTLSHVYMKQNIELKTKEATQTLKFVNKQLDIIEANLKKSEKKLEEFKTKEKTIDISMTAEQISKTLSEYEAKLSIIDMQISILKNTLNKIKKGVGLDTLTIVGLDIDGADGISGLIKNLQQAMLERRALLSDFTMIHPKVKKITTRIANLKRMIRQSISNILKSLKQKRNLIKRQMAKYQKQLQKLPKIQQNYLGLERKFTFNEKFYTYLLEKRTETQIKKAATVSQNRIVDKALLPKEPIKPNRKLIVAVGLILGFILGIFIAFLRAFLDNKILSVDDIEKNTNVPVIATIPKYKTKKGERRLLVINRPKSSVAEAFRTLRTNLQFMTKGEGSKVIAVTSTVASEGKTSIASNLGAVIQMLGKKVIILNFDLRKPTLHTLFDLPNTKGLSIYLSGHAKLNEIIIHTNIENLDIITAGTVPPNPSELINSDKAIELIEKLKKEYDYVILDTPPIGLVTDARILLTNSDAVLYVMRAEYSKKDFIKSINNIHKEGDVKSMGIVLNGVEAGHGYGYGYYED